MPFDQIIPYLIFTMVAAGTPGPSNVIVLATGSARGVVRGLPCIFGVATGMGGLMALSSFGLGAVILDQPMLQTAMKWAGAGFMLWLSWKIATAGASKPGEERPGVGFFAAVAFQAVNPKACLSFFRHPVSISTRQMATRSHNRSGSEGCFSLEPYQRSCPGLPLVP